jgi:hypothetical protein
MGLVLLHGKKYSGSGNGGEPEAATKREIDVETLIYCRDAKLEFFVRYGKPPVFPPRFVVLYGKLKS